MKKKTAWIDSTIKPKLVGVYQRDYGKAHNHDRMIGVAYSYWNGKRWGLYDQTVRGAALAGGLSSSHQNLPWRGLAQDPAKVKE